ncbi:DUF6531 domain-containing protein [Pendulispora rubella]|uniref:DUF6531 domain-containing protein n=1 Tax=Pendulispora rubella TaxID=2741070 RepID=A0ABZ2KZY2_9BACT
MFAGKQTDLVVGLDIHMEMVPAPPAPPPAGIPTPFPMPFIGMIEFSPGGLLLGMGMGLGMAAIFGGPIQGPVVINGIFQAAKTGDDATNKMTMPHVVIPPGFMWTPLPKPLKLKIRPPPPGPDPPAAPPGDAVLITGSKTVYFEGSNACRLPDLAMSCSDPVRLPSSVLLAIPKGLPVLAMGPPALDLAAAAKSFFLRNKWTAGLLQQVASLFPTQRLRNLASKAACWLTGHPVDIATGRLLTSAEDFVLRGPIPIQFERNYSSAWSERASPLGYGWSHTLHEAIWLERGKVVYKMGDGREVEFQCRHLPGRYLPDGGEIFNPLERLTLRRHAEGYYEVRTVDGLVREFSVLPGNTRVSFLTKIRDGIGHFVNLAYDRDCLLETVTTSEGRWIRLEHRDGLLRRIAVPIAERDDGWYNQVSFEYSADGDLVKAFDSQSNARVYRYENHLLIQETDRDGVTFWFEYDGRDAHANCVRTWGNDGKGQDRLFFRELNYDKKNMVTLVEDSLGHVTAYKMNVLNGVEEVIDPHGAATKFEYNEFLWKTAQIDALGNTTRYEYDARGNEISRVLPNGAQLRVEYDHLDQPVRTMDPLGVEWRWQYDRWGRLLGRWNNLGEGFAREYEGRVLRSVVRADGGRYLFDYDASENLSRITFPDGTTHEFCYDRQGNVIKTRDAAGRVRRRFYDWESRLFRIEETGGLWRQVSYSPEGDVLEYRDNMSQSIFGYSGYHWLAWGSESGERTEYGYSSEGQLISVINEAGEAHSLIRDPCGRVIEEKGFDGRTRTFLRDPMGRVSAKFRPDGQMETFAYDVMGNVVSVKYPDGEEALFSYDDIGNMLRATNSIGTVTLERDARGRCIKESFDDDWVASRYDLLGQRLEVASSRGMREKMTHMPMGSVQSIGIFERDPQGVAKATWGITFERDALGRETKRAMSGGVVARRDYDERGLPVLREIARGAELRARTEYAWEGDDRLRRRVDHGVGVTDYAHDGRGRLSAARYPDGTIQYRAPTPSGDLHKDPDRKDRQYLPGGVLHTADGAQFYYDQNGNLTVRREADGDEWNYTWDGANRLIAVKTPAGVDVHFAYDALGRRIKKTVRAESHESTTEWRWDGNVPIHEWKQARDGVEGMTTWIFEPQTFTPVAKVERARGEQTKKFGIISDYLGTPEEMIDEAGQIAWQAQLDIYGLSRAIEEERGRCPWRRGGQYEDTETGLYYNRFRYYDPSRGDYISQDPIGLAGGLRAYGYPIDPLVWLDPFGLVAIGDVGPYEPMAKAAKGTGLDAHHVGQQVLMKEFIPGYDPATAPSILVPVRGHRTRAPDVGIVKRTTRKNPGVSSARELLDRDIAELRRVYPEIPEAKIQELIEMNERMYPAHMKPPPNSEEKPQGSGCATGGS